MYQSPVYASASPPAASAPDCAEAIDEILRTIALDGEAGTNHATGEDRWIAEYTSAVLELVTGALATGRLRSGALSIVTALCEHLGCERVAIGLASKTAGTCRLVAVSGMAEVDPRAEIPRALEAAVRESLLRDSLTVWPGRNTDCQSLLPHAAPAHEKLSRLCGGAPIGSAPLRAAGGELIGAWVFIGDQTLVSEHNLRFIQTSSQPVATCLQALRMTERSAWRGWLPSIPARWSPTRRKCIAAGVAVALLSLLAPLPYKISCQCELQPTTRRFVGAPFEGVFDKSHAKPGDLVKRDQVLGQMDGRVVRWDLAGLTADQQRAGKSRDVNLAAGKVAAAQIDRLEMERFELKRQVLADRAEQLEIKSPVDGIVLSGDLQRSEGVAVTIGQPLYEVAPLDRMIAELAILDEEISHVAVGQTVTIRLDAYPGQTWTGELAKVYPRSEVRETENIFIAEVFLDNQDTALRPGMKGWVKVTSARHTLAWILLHKPCDYVLSWLGY